MKTKRLVGLFGLVLAGGISNRMGKDKSELDYYGVPQKDYAFQLLESICEKVFTSINRDASLSSFKNPIKDRYPINSPLNGILTAFHHSPKKAWLTLPVDMPAVDLATLQLLLSHRNINKMATCFYDSEGNQPEPLLAIWEPMAFESLMAFYQNGKKSPREFLTMSDVEILQVPDKKVLRSINTQEEFDAFKRSIANF